MIKMINIKIPKDDSFGQPVEKVCLSSYAKAGFFV